MANDLIMIACVKCGARIGIYKYYGAPESSYSHVSQDNLDRFITKHLFECQDLFGHSHLPHRPFDITLLSDPREPTNSP